MQLILSCPTAEDINIKMSTQTESPLNGNISEITEKNQAFRIDEESIAALEESLSRELPESEISNGITSDEEKSRDNPTITENICSISESDNIINGTSRDQTVDDLELKTRHLKTTSHHILNSGNKDSECLIDLQKESEGVLLSENSSNMLNDTNITPVCIDTTVPENPLKNGSIDTDNFMIDEEMEDDKPSKIDQQVCGSGKDILDDKTMHMKLTMAVSEYPDEIVMLEENAKLAKNPCDTITIKESNAVIENDRDSENLEDIAMHEVGEISIHKNKEMPKVEQMEVQSSENIISTANDLKSVAINERLPSLETDNCFVSDEAEVLITDEMNENELLSNVIRKDIKSAEIEEELLSNLSCDNILTKNTENEIPDKIDEKEHLSLQEDIIDMSTETKESKLVEQRNETLLPGQTCDNVILPTLPEAKDSKHTEISELNLPTVSSPNDNEFIAIVEDAEEPKKVLPLSSVTTDNVEQLKNYVPETNVYSIEESNNSHLNSTKISEINKDRDVEKDKNSHKEMDTVETLELDVNIHKQNSNIKSIPSDAVVSENTIVGDTVTLEAVADQTDSKNDILCETIFKQNSNIKSIPSDAVVSEDTIVGDTVTPETVADQTDSKNDILCETILKQNSNIKSIPSDAVVSEDTIVGDTVTPETVADQTDSKNDILCGTVDNNHINDKIESKEPPQTSLDKKDSENTLVTKNLENIKIPDDTSTVVNKQEASVDKLTKENQENIEIVDEDDVKIVEFDEETTKTQMKENSPERQEVNTLPVVCKLSNTLDILSDDDEEVSNVETNTPIMSPEEKQCINLDDDDDIMLIEEDININTKEKPEVLGTKEETVQKPTDKIEKETTEEPTTETKPVMLKNDAQDTPSEKVSSMEVDADRADLDADTAKSEAEEKMVDAKKPLLPQNFLKSAKKNLASMSRHELEDFCILRIVESIVDRSNLSEIKTQIKTMAQNLEDYKKRAFNLTKQNRDLQVVLKSVQEAQKNQTNVPIQPLKITRSVGMQVFMNDKLDPRRKAPIPNPVPTAPAAGPSGRPIRGVQSAKQIKSPATPPNIPVPRKVPVNNSPAKTLTNTPINTPSNKSTTSNPNSLRNPSPVQKAPEKRTHSRMQSTSSVTVDLTDDEPPAKIINKTSPSPVRVVAPQNLLAQQRHFPPINNARKVYIPISGPQAQQLRPGQTIVMKNAPMGPRPAQRMPMSRPQQTPVRPKQAPSRHPAPLPESMKQYTPAAWKALPPAPDLKLSKVENGIVISWKIDGYPEGGYETIASYQLYAYQETTAPPCTALWKKIGDVKALPLPMACTLTQFMAGFKYYFAVRAVDVRSRIGPFSLPGSILLLNKV